MAADWSIAVGVIVFLIATAFGIYYFINYKKFYLLAFVGSVATYIFSVFYIWDVFELSKNLVLLLLAISVGVMFYLGHYFSKLSLNKSHKTSKK